MTTERHYSPNGVSHLVINGRCATCGGDHADWIIGTCGACGRPVWRALEGDDTYLVDRTNSATCSVRGTAGHLDPEPAHPVPADVPLITAAPRLSTFRVYAANGTLLRTVRAESAEAVAAMQTGSAAHLIEEQD